MVSLISYSKNVYILSLLFFLKTFYAYTQSNKNFSVYFAISLEDCINCIQPIKEFNKIPKDFSPQIVMKENDKRVAKYFFQENMNFELPLAHTVFSDSLYNALQKNSNRYESYIHITWNAKVIKSIKLNKFTLQELQPYKEVKITLTRLLPQEILLGNFISVSLNQDFIYLFDYQFDKYYILSKNSKKLLKVFTSKDFDKLEIYKKIFGDTTNYHESVVKYSKILSQVNKQNIDLGSHHRSFESRDFIELGLSYVKIQDRKYHIYKEIVIAEWIKDNTFNVYSLEKSDKLPSNYIMSFNLLSYDKKTKKIFGSIQNVQPDTSTKLIAELHIDEKNKKIIFQKLKPLKFPNFVNTNTESYKYIYGYIHYPFYFFIYENLIGNIETGEFFQLLRNLYPNNSDFFNGKDSSLNYYVYDIIPISQNLFRILLKYQEKYIIVELNTKTREHKLVKEIGIPADKNYSLVISSFIFSSPNCIWAITPDNELMEIIF